MLARIDARQDNDWGRIGDTREYLRRFLPGYQARLRASGAIPIDASRSPAKWRTRYSPAGWLTRPRSQASKPGNQPGARSWKPSSIT